MIINFVRVNDKEEKSHICSTILNKLTSWFEIPESRLKYIQDVREHPFIKICDDQQVIGFASIKRNSEYVSEIMVMGIAQEYHRKGIGTMLFDHMIPDLRKQGVHYLEVKTLDESRECEEYRRTRLFYRKIGFIPVDVLYNEWGKDNPCLIMIMKL